MISEESCDTEDWNNGYWKFRISINTILKYIKIEKISIVILFHKFLLYILSNKWSMGEHFLYIFNGSVDVNTKQTYLTQNNECYAIPIDQFSFPQYLLPLISNDK